MNNSDMVLLFIQDSYLKATMPEWLPILLGMLVLYVPTLSNYSNGLWATEDRCNGPIMLVLAICLIFRNGRA